MNNITLAEIKNEVWRLLGQKPTSINFNNEVLKVKINNTLNKIWKGEVINILNPKEIIKSGDLSFQNIEVELQSNSNGLIMLPNDFQKLLSIKSNYFINENDIQILDKNLYILVLKNGNNKTYKIKYIKNTNKMLSDDDICDLPGDYSITTLAPLVAGILAYETNMPIATTLLTIAYLNLKELYIFYNEKIRKNSKQLKTKSYKFETVR